MTDHKAIREALAFCTSPQCAAQAWRLLTKEAA